MLWFTHCNWLRDYPFDRYGLALTCHSIIEVERPGSNGPSGAGHTPRRGRLLSGPRHSAGTAARGRQGDRTVRRLALGAEVDRPARPELRHPRHSIERWNALLRRRRASGQRGPFHFHDGSRSPLYPAGAGAGSRAAKAGGLSNTAEPYREDRRQTLEVIV